jgi:hypothetical protein
LVFIFIVWYCYSVIVSRWFWDREVSLHQYMYRHRHRVPFTFLTLAILVLTAILTYDPSLSVSAASVCPLRTGVPYVIPDRSAVYYITPECTRQVYRTEAVFFSHFDSWSGVRMTPTATIASIPWAEDREIPWGRGRFYPDGTLMRIGPYSRVYVVMGGFVYPLASEQILQVLFGTELEILNVTPEVIAQFPQKPMVESAAEYPVAL